MFYVGVGVAALGVYCFVASMSSRVWLWLPGKGPMIRAAEAEAIRTQFHAVAVGTLEFARIGGLALRESLADPDAGQVMEWYCHVCSLSMNVWGDAGMQVVTLVGVDEPKCWSRAVLNARVIDPTLLRIEGMIATVSSEQIAEGTDRDDVTRLRTERDYFRSLWRDLLAKQSGPATGPPMRADDA